MRVFRRRSPAGNSGGPTASLVARYGARAGVRSWAAVGMVALSMLPDADVVAFALGIPYAAPFGHRGATHSFLFAAMAGTLAALAIRSPRMIPWCAALVASHPLLDALTDGGLGVALLWPFDLTRFFAPWRPIPVSPIGAGFLSWRGLRVTLAEVVLFSPFYALALSAIRRRKNFPTSGGAPGRPNPKK